MKLKLVVFLLISKISFGFNHFNSVKHDSITGWVVSYIDEEPIINSNCREIMSFNKTIEFFIPDSLINEKDILSLNRDSVISLGGMLFFWDQKNALGAYYEIIHDTLTSPFSRVDSCLESYDFEAKMNDYNNLKIVKDIVDCSFPIKVYKSFTLKDFYTVIVPRKTTYMWLHEPIRKPINNDLFPTLFLNLSCYPKWWE